MNKELLTIRNRLKASKPTFRRHDSHKKKRVSASWRRPRGRQSKMRLHTKGYSRARSTGFGSPLAVKALSRTGFTQNVVSNVLDFNILNKANDGVIISRTVGMRRRKELIDFALKNSFIILNIVPEKFNKSFESVQAAKLEHKKVIASRKDSKAKQKKAAKKEKKATPELSDEEKKLKAKQEKDKLLIKGDQ